MSGAAGGRGALVLDGAADPGAPRLVVVPSAHEVATRAVDRILASVAAALEARGVAHIALTGGSTATAVYRALAADERTHATDWGRVHLWWGDDRFVPRGDRESNVLAVDVELLVGHHAQPIAIPPANVHPIPVDATLRAGGDATAAAATYAAELTTHLPSDGDGWPVFDLVLLGIGGDGHLLSVFPGSPAFDATAWAVGVPAPTHIGPHLPRVTLNPAIVPAARAILAMATGEGKAAVLAEVLRGPRDPRRLPGQLARRASATWILDADAAGRLESEAGVR